MQRVLPIFQKLIFSHFFLYSVLFFHSLIYAKTYNLSQGQRPPCTTSWAINGTTYSCTGDGRVNLASGDVITSSSNATISADNGFTIQNNTIGSNNTSINLVSTYGSIDVTSSTINGSLQSSSGAITLSGSAVYENITSSGITNLTDSYIAGNVSSQNGITTNNAYIDGTVISTNGNINLTGGIIYGKVTSSSNAITSNGTNLYGGATAQSGMSISNSTISGAFSLTSNNTLSLTNVTMTSGSISSAQYVVISHSNIGSKNSPIIVQANGTITVANSSIVYGNLTAAVWGTQTTIIKDPSSTIIGSCSPNYDFPCTPNTIVNTGTRDFALRNPINTQNLKGDLKVIGNTVLCVPELDRRGRPTGNCYNYSETDSNYELNLQYIDENTTDNRTYNNSSSALLSIPSNATIKWAALYTQGYLNGTNPTVTITALKEAVFLTLPSIGTIPSVPEVIDINPSYDLSYPYNQDGYTYDTYSPISALIGKNGESVNGWITGANIKANTGYEDSGVGNFGAWTLVVVYEDLNSTLKNISVFDGYKKVDNRSTSTATVNIPISGFLTPSNGIVKSTLSLFVGEGDQNIIGDKLYASNLSNTFVAINNTNAFNSSMSGFEARPSYTNNQGIDIQNHQIGVDGNTSHPQIIGNGQKNTTIQLTSSNDIYFPSMIAFSTELYVPDVCYEETITKNGIVPTQIFIGDTLDFEVLISNKSAEPAKKVSIKRIFNDNLEYQRNSTSVKSGSVFQSKTDSADSDVVTYTDSTNSLIVNLGTDANATNGGTINKDQNETFRYKFQPQTDGNITNAYLVTYRDDSNVNSSGSILYTDIPIGKCSDRKITSTVIPILPSGRVRIVESGKNWNENGGRLFTKIVNNPTNYDILYATNDTGAEPSSGYIKKVEILNIENLASPTIVATPIKDSTNINQRYPIRITHSSAYKRLQFKITLEDNTIATSNDFSVRPANFSGTLSDFWAGEPLTLNTLGMITARDNNGVASALYNQTLDTLNIDSITIDPSKTCSAHTIAALIGTFSTSFTDGRSTAVNATFRDIADSLSIWLKDSAWVSNSDDVMNSDCVAGSSSNTANATGQFGCNVEGNVLVSIKPYELNVTNAMFQVTNDINRHWLYTASDTNVNDMSVRATATVQANTMQHDALQNFTSTCYAQPVNLTFSYATNNTNGNINLSYTPRRGTLSSNLKSINDSNKTIVLDTPLFTTSSVTADYQFNIDRLITTPLNPVDMNLTAVTITAPNVAKILNNATRLENNAPTSVPIAFYYGRVYSTDYQAPTDINTTIRYEVYCKDCNTTRFNVIGRQSPTSLSWYQNPLHTNTMFGTVFQFSRIGTTTIANSTISTIDANGFDTSHPLTNATAPYVDRILMTPSTWLLFNPFNANATTNDFNVEFIRAVDHNWSGQGRLGNTVDLNTSTRTNRRMEW